MRGHNLVFSLYQIRLVGLLIVFLFFARLLTSVMTAAHAPDLVRLSAYGFITNALPLLPLGISLYLIGASHRRRANELRLLPHLCNSLPLLAVLFGLVLPVVLLLTLQQALSGAGIQTLTPYQQELVSATRVLPSITACVITGIGFFLLNRQMRRLFRRYGVDSFQFFGPRMT